MSIQLAMVALDVRDLQHSIEFYRLLGLEIPDPMPDRPGVQCRMASGVSLILVEHFAATSDPTWTRPERGQYQQILEFVADDREGVEELWGKLRDAGNHGRARTLRRRTGDLRRLHRRPRRERRDDLVRPERPT